MFTCIGSCRLTVMQKLGVSTNLLNINLAHSTKDILQLLKWVMKKIEIPNDITSFIFHSGMWSAKSVNLTNELIDLINNTDIFIFEICSYKSYQFNVGNSTYCCHTDILHAATLFQHIPDHVYNNVKMIKDSKVELKKDIEEILQLIGNRKMIIVTHILSSFDENIDRKALIYDLTNICNEKNIPIMYPGEILNIENREKIIPDYNHYTEEGLQLLEVFYKNKINELRF